jgi:hypothetical protein
MPPRVSQRAASVATLLHWAVPQATSARDVPALKAFDERDVREGRAVLRDEGAAHAGALREAGVEAVAP